jgi:parvulin-like peptidyl-prolyl isomerase
VGETVITAAAYESALQQNLRQQFYHGQVPQEKLVEFQRQVANSMIDRVLLLAESKRRGIVPQEDKVTEALSRYEARYAQSAMWQKNRETILPALRRELEERNAVEQLDEAARKVDAPSEEELRAFYQAQPQLFTQPQQIRLSVILLKVDPASPSATWEAAREEAAAIRRRMDKGEKFEELARIHSAHESAAKGGDMGYLHEGILPAALATEIRTWKPGVVSEPLRLLEGVALFRLEDVKPAQLHSFEHVKERATGLWTREQGELRWKALLESLRRSVAIKVDTARYPALAGAVPPGPQH